MSGGAGAASTLDVDGRAVSLTNLDRAMYPSTGTTKADVIGYYLAVSQALLAHAAGRPVTRKRWPDGVTGEGFFEKNLPAWAPDWLDSVVLPHHDRDVRYPLLRSRSDLAWTAQAGALELHAPQWRLGEDRSPAPPDRLVLDLDPGDGAGLSECAAIAVLLRDRLARDGTDCYPVTSGSKGIQLYARWPVPGSDDDHPSAYARRLARELESAHPSTVVSTMARSERTGRVLVDWSQNNPAKTTITPYSLRGRDRPTVAAPRTWDEIEPGRLAQLEVTEVAARVTAGVEPLAGLAP